ncbi:MAG: hypothetical protein R3F11_08480 [Verrucomicrobiales bacterium]
MPSDWRRENFDELLDVFSPERPVERDQLERLGLTKAMRDMVESGSYHFDPETRRFVPDQKNPSRRWNDENDPPPLPGEPAAARRSSCCGSQPRSTPASRGCLRWASSSNG